NRPPGSLLWPALTATTSSAHRECPGALAARQAPSYASLSPHSHSSMRFGSEYNPRRDESTTLTLPFPVHDRTARLLTGLTNSRYAPVILAIEPTLCYAWSIHACLLSSCLRRLQAGHDASEGHLALQAQVVET